MILVSIKEILLVASTQICTGICAYFKVYCSEFFYYGSAQGVP